MSTRGFDENPFADDEIPPTDDDGWDWGDNTERETGSGDNTPSSETSAKSAVATIRPAPGTETISRDVLERNKVTREQLEEIAESDLPSAEDAKKLLRLIEPDE